MHEAKVAEALEALGHRNRLRIFRFLVVQESEGASAREIGAAVNLSLPDVSTHLATLETAELIRSAQRESQLLYRTDHKTLGGVISYLIRDCCGKRKGDFSVDPGDRAATPN